MLGDILTDLVATCSWRERFVHTFFCEHSYSTLFQTLMFHKQDSVFTGCSVYRIVHVIFWKSKGRLVMAISLG